MSFRIRTRYVVLFGLLVTTSTSLAIAETVTRKCYSVAELAEIVYPDQLIVSVASDKANRWCRFSVSLPPGGPVQASIAYSMLEKGTITDKQYEGLVILPFTKSLAKQNAVPALSSSLTAQKGFITHCFRQYFIKNSNVDWSSKRDQLSCRTTQGALVVSWTKGPLTTRLFFNKGFFGK